jgi:hypothetical protein
MTRLGFETLTYQNNKTMNKGTKQQNSTDTQMGYDTVLAPVYCIGWRYNFKKGVEQCKHKHECKAFKDYDAIEVTYDLCTIRFDYIKEFRKCERWQNGC